MISSYADLQAFLANGGKMAFEIRPDAFSPWSDAATGQCIVSVLATRALADGKVEKVSEENGACIYAARSAA